MLASPHISETRQLDARHSMLMSLIGWRKCPYCGRAHHMDEVDAEFSLRVYPDMAEDPKKQEAICKQCFRYLYDYGCYLMYPQTSKRIFLSARFKFLQWILRILFFDNPHVEQPKASAREEAG